MNRLGVGSVGVPHITRVDPLMSACVQFPNGAPKEELGGRLLILRTQDSVVRLALTRG